MLDAKQKDWEKNLEVEEEGMDEMEEEIEEEYE